MILWAVTTRAVVLHDSKTKKYARSCEVNPEKELFVPHGVQSIAVDGFSCGSGSCPGPCPARLGFDTWAPRAVTRAHVLQRQPGEESIKVTGVAKETDVTTEPPASLCRERQRTFWNGPSKWLTRLLKKERETGIMGNCMTGIMRKSILSTAFT